MSTPPLARLVGGAIVVGIPLVLVAGAVGSPELEQALIDSAPVCPFLTVTGWPCPFCGMTRATVALGSGELGAALAYHPFAPLILAATSWGAWRLARGRLPGLGGRRDVVVAAAGLAAIWIAKLVTGA